MNARARVHRAPSTDRPTRPTERARDDARAVDGTTPMSATRDADASSSGRSPVTPS
jgi:hypothetical protein